MWIAPFIAIIAAAYILITSPVTFALVWPILVSWFLSPAIAWWVSKPLVGRVVRLTDKQYLFLRELSRKTWSFFETFVGAEDNWLPPDNYQEHPAPVIAHRTSPTNMGLSLLSNLSAYDFGYILSGELIERTSNAFHTMQLLERFQGHFYNWYDTKTLSPLRPIYISSVDSGNLAGHLMVLQQGLLTLKDKPVQGPRLFEGIRDTLIVLTKHAGKSIPAPLVQFQKYLESILENPPENIDDLQKQLKELVNIGLEVKATFTHDTNEQFRVWVNKLCNQCQHAFDELTFLLGDINNQAFPDEAEKQVLFRPCLKLPKSVTGQRPE
jgi:hypothetical protein